MQHRSRHVIASIGGTVMSVVVLPSAKMISRTPAVSGKAEAPRISFLRRAFDAIVAAQMARAEHEVALYIQRTGRDPRK